MLLFIKETAICNFPDDVTLYPCGKDLDAISNKLELETSTVIQCPKDFKMVTNPSKFQLMFVSKYKNIETNMSFDGKTIKASDAVQLVGITPHININFKQHMQNISKIFVTKQTTKPKLFSI